MKYELCYGTVPIRRSNAKWQVFLLLHKKGRFWGFPKGHSNEKEDPFATAQRELKEETNLEINKKWPFIFRETYQFERNKEKIQKKVMYFLVETQGEIIIQKNEILEGKWVDIIKAVSLITFFQSQKIMHEVAKILEKEQTF